MAFSGHLLIWIPLHKHNIWCLLTILASVLITLNQLTELSENNLSALQEAETVKEFADSKALITWGPCLLNVLPAALITPCSACVTHSPSVLDKRRYALATVTSKQIWSVCSSCHSCVLRWGSSGSNSQQRLQERKESSSWWAKGDREEAEWGTFVLLSQLVSHVPVLVAPQDVVGDVDVAGSHVVDALRDGDGPRRGGAGGARAASSRVDGRRAQGHGRWCFCAPVRGKGRVSSLHTRHFLTILNTLEKLAPHPSQGRMCSSISWFYEKAELINWEWLKIKRDLILPINEPVIKEKKNLS